MLVTVVMLGIALLATGDALWLIDRTNYFIYGNNLGGVAAICYFRKLNPRSTQGYFAVSQAQTPSMVICILVLCFGYFTQLIKLSSQAAAFTRLWMRTKPSTKLKARLNNARRQLYSPEPSGCLKKEWRIKYLCYKVLHVTLRALLDLYESMLWELRRLVVVCWTSCRTSRSSLL